MIYTVLADNCKKPRDYFTKEVKRRGNADWYVTPKKAVKLGLADQIGLPKLQIDVDVQINLAIPDDHA